MERFNSPSSFDQLSLLFKLWEMLLTGDVPKSLEIDEILKQLTLSEKQITRRFFELIIDQPAFMSEDHKRLRALLIDWYAAQRTMITRSDNVSDPFSLADEALSELIKSFGFPYPNRIITGNNKVLFFLDLVNLYNKKGTPEVLARALQYFGLQNVRISEWWIHRRMPDEVFVARSQIVVPRLLRDMPAQELNYEEFIATDPYWRLTLSDLSAEYNNSLITLPSITPHISIDAAVPISSLYAVYAILTKKMQESFDRWNGGGGLYQDIIVERYGTTISFLELAIAITYLFNSTSTTSGPLFYQYQEALDINDDGIDDVDYQVIIDEYNNISSKPTTRAQRDLKLTQLKEKFSGQTSNFFYGDPTDAGTYLELMNSDLKDMIDDDIASLQRELALESLFLTLDGYIQQDLGLTNVSLSHLIYGSSTYERLKPIINFFKPYRVRIRELLTSFAIEEPVQHSMLAADYLALSWRWIIEDREDDTISVDDKNVPGILGINNIHADSYRMLDSALKEEYFTGINIEHSDCLVFDSTSDYLIFDSTSDYSMEDECGIEVVDNLVDGLIGFWPLDFLSLVAPKTLRDRSGNANHGIAFADPLFDLGPQYDVEGSTIFDSTSAVYIDLGSPLFDTTSGLIPYSGTGWIETDTDGTIISQFDGGPNRFRFGIEGGNLMYSKGGDSTSIVSVETVDDGEFRFVGFTKDSTGNVRLYIDAEEDGFGIDEDPFANVNTEISMHRAPTDGLVGYWDLGEENIEETKVQDLSGYENHGTPKNIPVFIEDQLDHPNHAMEFDGGDYVDCGDDAVLNFGTNEFTIAFWIYFEDFDNSYYFIGKREDGSNRILLYYYKANDRISLTVTVGGVEKISLRKYNINLTPKTWYHFIYEIKQGSTSLIYLDNVVYESYDVDTHVAGDYDNAGTFKIGSISDGSGVKHEGGIKEVRIYDRILSEDEKTDLFESHDDIDPLFGCGARIRLYAGKLSGEDMQRIFNFEGPK